MIESKHKKTFIAAIIVLLAVATAAWAVWEVTLSGNLTASVPQPGEPVPGHIVTEGTCTAANVTLQARYSITLNQGFVADTGSNFVAELNNDTDGDGLLDQGDADGDGWSNYHESKMGTDPNISSSKPNPTSFYEYDAFGRIKRIERTGQ